VPLDRNAKYRIWRRAQALKHRFEAGKHYGRLTGKFIDVLRVLLWEFHNAHTGRCFPSYEAIAAKAGVARSTVYEAIKALEREGLLTWQNRLVYAMEWTTDLFGRGVRRWRAVRTSNAYQILDPMHATPAVASKSEFPPGTLKQKTKKENKEACGGLFGGGVASEGAPRMLFSNLEAALAASRRIRWGD
jgi:hypothetical protein